MPGTRSATLVIFACLVALVMSLCLPVVADAKDSDGTDGDDRMNGTERSDMMAAGKGRDTVRGLQGDDELYGGIGDDNGKTERGFRGIYGGMGKDTLYGRGGNDILDGGDGEDRIRGGNGNDRLIGHGDNSRTDRIFCGDGNDEVLAGIGDAVDKESCENIRRGVAPGGATGPASLAREGSSED